MTIPTIALEDYESLRTLLEPFLLDAMHLGCSKRGLFLRVAEMVRNGTAKPFHPSVRRKWIHDFTVIIGLIPPDVFGVILRWETLPRDHGRCADSISLGSSGGNHKSFV